MKLGSNIEIWVIDINLIKNSKGILNTLLGYYLNKVPSKIKIIKNAYGKPILKNSEIHFNISKRKNLIIYAFSKNQPVGIDLEAIKYISKITGFSHFVFNKAYLKHFSTLSKLEKKARFFELWTLYEAYGKLIGNGLLTVVKKPTPKELKRFFKYYFKPKKGFVATLVAERSRKVVFKSTCDLIQLT